MFLLLLAGALGCSTEPTTSTATSSGGAIGSGGALMSNSSGGIGGNGAMQGPGGATSGGSETGGAADGSAPSGGQSNRGGAPGSGGTRPSAGGIAGLAGGGTTSDGGSSGGSAGAADVVKASTMAASMGRGTNIGNTLENTAMWETGWGQPAITKAFIDGIASRGIKTVRVPVAWNTYATNGVVDASKMNRVKEVVGLIEAAGMYSIVNIHWDGGWIDNENNSNKFRLTDDVKTKFASYWTQIASAFSSVGHRLVFEGLNEEGKFYVNGDTTKAPDYAALNQLNQLFVTTVRAQSGYNKTRALLIAGFVTDIELTCVDAFTVPTDPAGPDKLFLSLHYYTPFTFCGLETVESWGSPATTWGTDAEKATLENLFTKLAAFSTKKKIPVILGEFGVTRGEKYVREPASRIRWMESVYRAAESRGMVPLLWDTGSEIKRSDGSFSPELQTVMSDLK